MAKESEKTSKKAPTIGKEKEQKQYKTESGAPAKKASIPKGKEDKWKNQPKKTK